MLDSAFQDDIGHGSYHNIEGRRHCSIGDHWTNDGATPLVDGHKSPRGTLDISSISEAGLPVVISTLSFRIISFVS
jgi:hypothetical protein